MRTVGIANRGDGAEMSVVRFEDREMDWDRPLEKLEHGVAHNLADAIAAGGVRFLGCNRCGTWAENDC